MSKVLSLFSGCGGMDFGFEQAGYSIVAANEFWHPAAMTYQRNLRDTTMIVGDINDPKVKDNLVMACNGFCDVLVGGPPHQAYSLSGKCDPNDPSGRLFEAYIEMVSRTNPKFTVMGILSMRHPDGKVGDLISDRMDEIGYKVLSKTMDASNYGTPQRRQMVIFIGVSKQWLREKTGSDDSPCLCGGLFPPITHEAQGDFFMSFQPLVTVRKAIGDLMDVPEHSEWNHVFTKHSEEYVRKIHRTPIGRSVTGYSKSCYRCPPDLPSKTVKANNGGVFIHYEKDRCMSARELARLQGFPDDFVFKGTKSDILKQIGNAMPPPLARAIGRKLSDLVGISLSL